MKSKRTWHMLFLACVACFCIVGVASLYKHFDMWDLAMCCFAAFYMGANTEDFLNDWYKTKRKDKNSSRRGLESLDIPPPRPSARRRDEPADYDD